MLLQLIQSLLLLACCTVLQSSQNSTQRDIVSSWLSQKYEMPEAPIISRPYIEPLPSTLQFHRPTIRANHIKELCETGNIEQAYNSYATIAPHMPNHLFLLNPKAQQACTSIHASMKQIDKSEKITGVDVLKNIDYAGHPEIEAACQFLTHYENSTLSAQDAVKKFIQTICSQKGLSNTLSNIARTPLCSHVTRKLETASFDNKDSILPNLYYVIAELHYKNKNYTKARDFYLKNKIVYLKEKKITAHAFEAYIAATATFDKDDIAYLTSLVGNVDKQLQQLDKTDQALSYQIALATHALIQHNDTMSIEQKRSLLHNGLDHLAYAQKHTGLTAQFHALLSDVYDEKNYSASALKHLKQTLHNDEIITILTHAEQTDATLYNTYAPWTKMMLDYIEGRQQICKQKNLTRLHEFVASDLCAQLMPYCQRAHITRKNSNNDILFLMALHYKNNGHNALACHYIDKLSDPIPHAALSLKSTLYAAAHKQLPDAQFKTIITSYINNKKPSLNEQQEILSLLQNHHAFFIHDDNYKLASKLIRKITELQDTPWHIIRLASGITKWLDTTHNTYLNCWHNELNACQFYTRIQDPSCYDSSINIEAGRLLMIQKSLSPYEKIISYFTTALASNKLAPDIAQETQNACSILYCKWAKDHRDPETALRLFDLAIQYDQTDASQFERAYFILHTSNDTHLIDKALKLLEDNIQKNSNNKDVLLCLVDVLSGTTSNTHPEITEKYINLEQAIKYLTILIETNSDNIEYILARMRLYDKINNPTKAIEDINLLLNQNLANTGIAQANLLLFKTKLLLDTSAANKYDEALECIQQLRSYEDNGIVTIGIYPKIQEYINSITANKDMSENAIEWCCIAAETYIAQAHIYHSDEITPEQHELAHYLFKAAQMGNTNAQVTLFLYLSLIHYTNLDYFLQSFQYAHTALCNISNTSQNPKVYLVLRYLQKFAEEGFAVACYILCDYYKEDAQNLEKIMLLFSKVHKHHHYFSETEDIVEKICASCKDSLIPYVTRYMGNPKKRTVIDAIATFTLGSMYQYNNSSDIITMGRLYLKCVLDNIDILKLSHYRDSIHLLFAQGYYKEACHLQEKTNIPAVELLRRSAQLGLLAAAHDLARIYIEQHKTGNFDLAINTDDFLPVLTINQAGDNPHPDSRQLFKEYLILACAKETVKNSAPQEQQEKTDTIDKEAIKKAIYAQAQNKVNIIQQRASEKNMIRYPNYKEVSPTYNTALEQKASGNGKEALPHLHKAISKEHHPSACIMLALSYLTAEITPQDYNLSEKFLKQALSYGLKPKDRKNPIAQFHNISFLHMLLLCVDSLATGEHPATTKNHLLSTIKETLVKNEININDFGALYKEMENVDLSTIPGWSENKKTTEKKELDLPRLIKSMIKDPEEQPSANFVAYGKATKDGDMVQSVALSIILIQEKNPTVYLNTASGMLMADSEKNYDLTKKHLCEALNYGLVSQKFCDCDCLYALLNFMKNVEKFVKNNQKKEKLFSIVMEAFGKNNINVEHFNQIFKKYCENPKLFS